MKPKRIALLLSCEHAGNHVPREHKHLFTTSKAVLETHRGIDIGAFGLAKLLQKKFKCKLISAHLCRLLVDHNRSIDNPSLFSEFSRGLNEVQKEDLLETYYWPHRHYVEKEIKRLTKSYDLVVHIAVHSFTPFLRGITRDCDIGLLYDPHRSEEAKFIKKWQKSLQKLSDLRIKRNYPYWGHTDGFGKYLRSVFPQSKYLSFELEVNQAILKQKKKHRPIAKLVYDSLINII